MQFSGVVSSSAQLLLLNSRHVVEGVVPVSVRVCLDPRKTWSG